MNEPAQYITGMDPSRTCCARCGHAMTVLMLEREAAALAEAGATPDGTPRFCERCGEPLQAAPPIMAYAAPARPTLRQRIRNRRPWGFWGTTLLTLSTIAIHAAVGIAAVLILLITQSATRNRVDFEAFIMNLEHNGMFLAVTTSIIAVLSCTWLHGVTWLRGVPWREYFAAYRPSGGTVAFWVVILLGWLVLEEAYTTYYLVDAKTSLFMSNIYETAGFMPLFLLGVVVAAPISEEWLFRGFMFKGYAQSPVGIAGAIGIPSFFWALMHLQYDVGFIGVIFAMGLLLGIARYATGTVVVPIIMHMTCNLLATLQVAYDIRLFPLD